MKKLIIIIIMIISSCKVFSQLEIPDMIDLGEVYLSRVDYTDTVGLKFNQTHDANILVKNCSDNEFYLLGINHERKNNHPYLLKSIVSKKIRTLDSVEFTITVVFPYKDNNNLIDSSFVFRCWLIFRNAVETRIDSIEMTIKFTTKEASGYYYQAEKSDIYPFADLNKPSQEVKFYIGGTINYLEEFNIDSIKYSSDVNSIKEVRLLKGGICRTLPITQKTKDYIGFNVYMDISEYKDTKIDLEIYGIHIKQSSDVKYTISYIFRPRLYTNHIQFNSWGLNYVPLSRFRNSKDFELIFPKMANFTPKQYTIKNIEFIVDYPEYVKTDYTNPPIELPKIQDSKIFYTNVDLGRIFISTPNQEEFENNVLIIFHLEDENGYKQKESLYLKYFIDPILSVGEEEEQNEFFLYPNPATDYITINTSGINTTLKRGVEGNELVEIYDLMGIITKKYFSQLLFFL